MDIIIQEKINTVIIENEVPFKIIKESTNEVFELVFINSRTINSVNSTFVYEK